MTKQQWRKALWHLRHGGIEGFKKYRTNSRDPKQSPSQNSNPSAEIDALPTEGPELSVIVPAYNSSDFIDACLRSVLSQTGVELEVIIIDDGSTDDTAAIAERLAEHDERVSVLSVENSGPAKARNLGVSSARGTFIAFADADDEVLPGAYNEMTGSLIRTGSDIATGSYIRVGRSGRSRPKVTARVHARRRLAVRLDDMPELLEEPVLWNKVYRRDFWNRHVGEMTSFANYEDQEPVYRALVGAAAIDVLTSDVYAWRLADGRNTRSRRKARTTDLNAKIEVVDALRIALEHEPDHVQEHGYAIWVGTDLAMHAEYLDTASKRFRKTLCSAVNALKKTMPRNAWKLIPAQERLFMWVVAAGRLHDIEEILGTRVEETTAVPLEYVEGRWIVAPTYVSRLETPLPPRLLKARAVDLMPSVVVRNTRWVGEREIELQGCAYIPGVDPADVTVRMHGVMDGATAFDVPVESREDNRIDLEVGDPWRSYAAGGFRARIDLGAIDNVSSRGIDLFGAFEAHGAHFRVPAVSTAIVGMIAPGPLAGRERMTVFADEHDEVSIRPVAMPSDPVLTKNVTMRGNNVTVTLSGDTEVRAVELVHRAEFLSMTAQSRSIFNITLPDLPEKYAAGGERIWSVRARLGSDIVEDIYYEAVDYLLPDTGRVRPVPNADGKVRIAQRSKRVSITGASSDRDRLLLAGRIDPPEKLSVVLKSSAQTIAPAETTMHADGSFTAVYDLTTTGPEGGTVAALSGGYHIRFGATPESADLWARVAGKLAIRPVDCFTEWNTVRLEGRTSGSVALTASAPWSARERTKYGRFALRQSDWGPVREGILFESFNGKSSNDNPRALFDAICEIDDKTPFYWSVRDRTVEVPEGGIPVVEGTAAWHKALATTKVWVNNNNFPYYVRKRSGQFYLQTWHGTPIKKLLENVNRRKIPLSYRRLMKTEVPQWDLLLAQSPSAAQNLRSGLGYDGPIQIMEYPRNCRLLTSMNDPVSIRHRLGLAAGEKVVLFVPTWRNADRQGTALHWKNFMDMEELAHEGNARVLVRAHHVARSNGVSGNQVLDVSGEPHVEDLMAVTDVLVTDYSSIAYDFEITGRPVIHFVPDGDAYRRERGLYEDCNTGNYQPRRVAKTLEELKIIVKSTDPSDISNDSRRIGAVEIEAQVRSIVEQIIDRANTPTGFK
ncbi:bifunctional glycosyltransferase/CDP-glycerol:glycerophosphate glycerophosphotransferase [Brevibacterium aurantiacum]|uniref:bifunctional glycosyltransferase/CDP-glycerol:glycerophosphate glycerophosphotransferase n=1 Tax=Brevibacterium aurantiacum TaxID=273384 RepID=UPI0018686AB9|nr:CDP-glycerol glycerophosphotransferase family protein [Brevibacterium aurantiacum]